VGSPLRNAVALAAEFGSTSHIGLHAWHGLDPSSRTACTRARKAAWQAALRDRKPANPLAVSAGRPSWICRLPIVPVFFSTYASRLHSLSLLFVRVLTPRAVHGPMISGGCELRFAAACDTSVTRVHRRPRGGCKRLTGITPPRSKPPQTGVFASFQRCSRFRTQPTAAVLPSPRPLRIRDGRTCWGWPSDHRAIHPQGGDVLWIRRHASS